MIDGYVCKQVIVFDSEVASNQDSALASPEITESGASFFMSILRYLETPQYLRRSYFPMCNNLKYVVKIDSHLFTVLHVIILSMNIHLLLVIVCIFFSWKGLLPPLDAPHHVRKHEWSPYREGFLNFHHRIFTSIIYFAMAIYWT